MTTTTETTRAAEIPISKIRRTENIRHDVELDDDFVTSIDAQGILVRCTVEPLTNDPDGYEYLCVAGHRRIAAAEYCHGPEYAAPCEVLIDGQDTAERVLFMLTENLQRHDLDPIDEALAYAKIVGCGWTIDELARSVGRPAKRVSQRIALLNLDDTEHDDIRAGKLTLGDAQSLATITDPEIRTAARKRPHFQTVAQFVADYKRDRAQTNRLARRLEECERLGINAGTTQPKGSKPVGKETYSGVALADADAVKAHLAEPCSFLAITASRWESRLHEQQCCTNPARHSTEGPSALKHRGGAAKPATPKPATSSSSTPPPGKALADVDLDTTEPEPSIAELRDRAITAAADRILAGTALSSEQRDAMLGLAIDIIITETVDTETPLVVDGVDILETHDGLDIALAATTGVALERLAAATVLLAVASNGYGPHQAQRMHILGVELDETESKWLKEPTT